jgi:hypothetical protein
VKFIADLLRSDVIGRDMPRANKFMLHLMSAIQHEAEMISKRKDALPRPARGVKLGGSRSHLFTDAGTRW